MNLLSSIISSIWNTVTFMDKEQCALVAHVLTVSQAHPKSFEFRNGAWRSDSMKIDYIKKLKYVNLSGVCYHLGWRANAILAKHFAMLHICLHHEHIGKALSEIDRVEYTPAENKPEQRSVMEMMDGYTYDNQQNAGDIKPPKQDLISKIKAEQPESIDLSEFVGKEIVATKRDGWRICGEVKSLNNGCYHISGHIYLRRGVVWHCGRPPSMRDIVKIEYVSSKPVDQKWTTDIDLTKWIGKRVDVKLRDGRVRNAVGVEGCDSLTWNALVSGSMYTQEGRYYDRVVDDRDIVAIRLST